MSAQLTAEWPRVLATGGTGLVGSAIVRRLVAAGCSVQVISRRSDYPAPPGVSMYRGHLTDTKDVAAAMRGCDAVFHCAAETRDPDSMAAVNVTATRLLLEAARNLGLNFFCYLSSVGVIGRTRAKLVDESAPCHPMNLYAESKLAAEQILSDGLPGGSLLILRPTNIFGPETLRPWLHDSIRSRVRQFLTGREKSHLIYVEDVAAAAVHLFQMPRHPGVDTFIVSSDEEPEGTNREVQAALASMIETAPRPSINPAPLWVPHCARLIRHGQSNLGDVTYSSHRLFQAGYRMPYGLRNGLIEAVRLMREPLAIPGSELP
jgi:nucleoside-diphosphate-sugar epimerase